MAKKPSHTTRTTKPAATHADRARPSTDAQEDPLFSITDPIHRLDFGTIAGMLGKALKPTSEMLELDKTDPATPEEANAKILFDMKKAMEELEEVKFSVISRSQIDALVDGLYTLGYAMKHGTSPALTDHIKGVPEHLRMVLFNTIDEDMRGRAEDFAPGAAAAPMRTN